MSLKFLVALSERELPSRISNPQDIVHVDILQAAQLVVAEVPVMEKGDYAGDAVVLSITPLGQSLAESIRKRTAGSG